MSENVRKLVEANNDDEDYIKSFGLPRSALLCSIFQYVFSTIASANNDHGILNL